LIVIVVIVLVIVLVLVLVVVLVLMLATTVVIIVMISFIVLPMTAVIVVSCNTHILGSTGSMGPSSVSTSWYPITTTTSSTLMHAPTPSNTSTTTAVLMVNEIAHITAAATMSAPRHPSCLQYRRRAVPTAVRGRARGVVAAVARLPILSVSASILRSGGSLKVVAAAAVAVAASQ
jgi:hypothetical protein